MFKTSAQKDRPMNRVRSCAIAFLVMCVASGASAADDALRPREFQVTAGELAEAMGLDIYSYALKADKGDKFKISLREISKQDAEPAVLFSQSFTVAAQPRDGDIRLLISFLKSDNTIGSALRSNLPEMKLTLSASTCSPRTVTKTTSVPLKDIGNKKVERGSGAAFLSIEKANDGDAMAYPMAELIIEREK
jgi:hypothetical protein